MSCNRVENNSFWKTINSKSIVNLWKITSMTVNGKHVMKIRCKETVIRIKYCLNYF